MPNQCVVSMYSVVMSADTRYSIDMRLPDSCQPGANPPVVRSLGYKRLGQRLSKSQAQSQVCAHCRVGAGKSSVDPVAEYSESVSMRNRYLSGRKCSK
jgi:hypothetical protein